MAHTDTNITRTRTVAPASPEAIEATKKIADLLKIEVPEGLRGDPVKSHDYLSRAVASRLIQDANARAGDEVTAAMVSAATDKPTGPISPGSGRLSDAVLETIRQIQSTVPEWAERSRAMRGIGDASPVLPNPVSAPPISDASYRALQEISKLLGLDKACDDMLGAMQGPAEWKQDPRHRATILQHLISCRIQASRDGAAGNGTAGQPIDAATLQKIEKIIDSVPEMKQAMTKSSDIIEAKSAWMGQMEDRALLHILQTAEPEKAILPAPVPRT